MSPAQPSRYEIPSAPPPSNRISLSEHYCTNRHINRGYTHTYQENMGLLRINNLKVKFDTSEGPLIAVDDISLCLDANEIFGLVGESGAGKSTIGRAILGIIDSKGEIEEGEIIYKGEDLVKKSEKELQAVRGNQIGMIYQDPNTALNPVLTIREQMERVIKHNINSELSDAEMFERMVSSLEKVQIPNPEKRLDNYPVEFSGGMNQRVMIAMALLPDPDLLIADEPTTNLDVTIQAQINTLLNKLKNENGMSVLHITHNLGIVAQHCEKVGVLYCGKVVEEGPTRRVFENPSHPYTKDLLKCVPDTDNVGDEMFELEGKMPVPKNLPDICYYANRCSEAQEKCWNNEPKMESGRGMEPNHKSACFFKSELS